MGVVIDTLPPVLVKISLDDLYCNQVINYGSKQSIVTIVYAEYLKQMVWNKKEKIVTGTKSLMKGLYDRKITNLHFTKKNYANLNYEQNWPPAKNKKTNIKLLY